MYVCICNGVTDHEIRRRVEAGTTAYEALQYELGVGTCCGQCADCARSVIEETLEQRSITSG